MARDPNHEVRKKYEQFLGPELGSLFSELWQELAWLHSVWQEYRVIFGTTPEQLDIANEAAGGFFYIIQKYLWEGVLLDLARLTDPAISYKKANLSVLALEALVDPGLRPEIADLATKAVAATAFARDWRNRYIAHKDLTLAIGKGNAPPLQPASRAAIEVALNALDEILNAVDRHYSNTSTMFRVTDSYRGSKRLLTLLKKGLEAEKTERRDFRKRCGLQTDD